jgi:Neutral/alkaline non-lysosomal ceramidase, N-terminal
LRFKFTGRRLLLPALSFCLILFAFAAASSAEEAGALSLYAGAAKVDITPDQSVYRYPLAGYGGRGHHEAKGVLDPIYARALVVRDPSGTMIALISMDLCYINSDLRDRITNRLLREGFQEQNVLVAATHNHSGFGGFDQRGFAKLMHGIYDPRMLDFAAFGAQTAVLQAKQALVPAGFEWGEVELSGMNRSRLDPAFDVAEGGQGQIKPDPVKYPVDNRLVLLRFVDADSATIALTYHFASHPTVISPESFAVSADWPGASCGYIEKNLGKGAVALFFNGALGDAAPAPDWDTVEKEIENTRVYGEDMGAQVVNATKNLKPYVPGERKVILSGNLVSTPMPKLRLKPLGGWPLPGFIAQALYVKPEVVFQAVRIGDVVLMAFPGEPTNAVGRQVESNCGDKYRCVVVAPANDYFGYFVTPSQWDGGTYAADACFFGRDAVGIIEDGLKPAINAVK